MAVTSLCGGSRRNVSPRMRRASHGAIPTKFTQTGRVLPCLVLAPVAGPPRAGGRPGTGVLQEVGRSLPPYFDAVESS